MRVVHASLALAVVVWLLPAMPTHAPEGVPAGAARAAEPRRPAPPFLGPQRARPQLQDIPRDTPALLTAEEVTYDEDLGIITARGRVEVSQGPRIMLADQVTYNQRTDTVIATGNVSLVEPSGEVLFSDYAEMSADLKDGLIENLRVLLTDNSRLAANGAIRTDGSRKEMSKGVFSPCELCKDNPSRAPLWQIKAVKVVHDEDTHDIEYTDATLEMFGVPVAYAPYFRHPDPTVKQRSGFLTPRAGRGSDTGLFFGVPYHYAIDHDRDLTIEPIIYEKEGLLLLGEYRQRFAKGELQIQASGAQVDEFENGVGTGNSTQRGHIKAKGRYDYDETWRGGADVYKASDRTYLKRFDLGREDVLINRAYAEGFRGRNYASATAYHFQDLRADTPRERVPLILPLLEYHHVGLPNLAGGYWTLDSSLLSLGREDGQDSRRLATRNAWTVPYVGPLGDVYSFTASLQTDIYYVNDVPDPDTGGATALDGATGRAFPQVSLGWRYPWIRRDGNQRQLIEPVVNLVAGPNGSNPNKIANEDSRAFEFDESNLFSRNRYSGFDRVSSGQRVDYGINLASLNERGNGVRGFMGQSWRTRADSTYAVGSGLEDKSSDYVGRLLVTPASYLDLLYRFRLDRDNFSSRRTEFGFNAGPPRFRIGADYVALDTQRGTQPFGNREQVQARVDARFGDSWGFGMRTVRDLTGEGNTRLIAAQLRYIDECFIATIDFERRFLQDNDIKPGNSLMFRVIFKYLGEVDTRASVN
jgi:LPS-assembly protein